MTVQPMMVTFDCLDTRSLARWWAECLGATVAEDFGEYVALTTGTVHLAFQQVPDPTPGKNRVHVDFRSDDRAADVARVVELGATVVAEHDLPDGPTWTVLADPEGNQFCFVDVPS